MHNPPTDLPSESILVLGNCLSLDESTRTRRNDKDLSADEQKFKFTDNGEQKTKA